MTTDIPKTNNHSEIIAQLEHWYPLQLKSLPSSIFEGAVGIAAGAASYAVTNPGAIFNSAFFDSMHLQIEKDPTALRPPTQGIKKALWDAVVKENKIGYIKPLSLTLIGAPIFKELIFRGGLYLCDSSKQPFKDKNVTDETGKSTFDTVKEIGENVLLFTAAHFDPRIGLKESAKVMLPVAVIGLTCTILANETQNLIPSTLAHSAYNALVMNGVYRTAKLYSAKKPVNDSKGL